MRITTNRTNGKGNIKADEKRNQAEVILYHVEEIWSQRWDSTRAFAAGQGNFQTV
jgi:hypothetical protein